MKKKVFSRLIVSLLLLMLITALSATLITASEEDIEMEDMMSAILSDEELSGYKQGDTVSLSNDGYIGIPVELTTYYDSSKPTKSGYDVDATNLVIYVVNAHFERVGADTDVEIIKSMLERGYIVTVADYKNNGRAISPDLDFSLQAVRNTVLTGKYFTDTTVFASGSYYNSFVVPSGYDVSLHRVFWEIDKHSTDGTLEKIVEYWNNDFRAWTKNKDIVIPWVDENGNRKQTQTAHDGTAPVWLNADGSENPDGTYIKIKHTRAVDITDCVKRDGSPIDLNLYMHLIYPTGAAEVPVLALVGSAEHIAKGTASADRPQFIGATLRGYAAVTFDHGWTPMARNDHYGYFDGSTPDMGSVTGNNTTYSIQFYNEVEIATAAMRYIRYLSLSTDEFNFKLDAIGAYGNSKGGWMQFLGAVDPYTASGERKIFIGHHGETRYENGKTETVGIIDGGEEQPWLTYDGEEIDGGADFVYCSCGGTSESILPGHAPMFISCQLNDGSCWGSSREFIMAARAADVPAMWVEVNLGHTFASGPDTKFGIDDTYSSFFNFLGYWLKGDRVRVEYIYADMTYGGMPTYAPFTVKFTGPVGESEIGKIILAADDGIAVSGRWESAFGNTEWTFYPDFLKSNTEYTLTVPAGIKAANGGTSENASSYSVTTGYESADVLTRVTGSRGTYISFTVPDKSGITEFDVNKYLLRIKASNNAANKLGIYSVSGFDQSSPDSSTVGEELGVVYVNGDGYYEVDISEFISSYDAGATVTLLIKEERTVGNPTVFSWDVSTTRPGTLLVSNTVESQVVELDGNAVLEIGKTKPTGTYPLDPFYNNLSYNTIINCTALVRSGNMTVDDSGRRLNISFRVLDTTSRTLQIYVLDASNRAKGIIDRDGTVFNVRTKADEWVDVSFTLDIYDPLKYGADGLFNKKVYIKTYGFGEEVYPIYFDDFKSVEEITAVDISQVSLVSTTTEQRKNPLETEYGTIPEQYASVEDYPFAVFNSNGGFVLATDIWATDSGTGALGAGQKQSYVNLIILLRRDYHFTDATVYNNFAFYYGDLKLDLGDNKLYLEQTHSEGLFFCHAKRSHRTDVVIENGEIVFGGGKLISVGSWDTSGYTYQSEVKQFNFTFDAVTFSHSGGSTAAGALFTNAASGSPVPVISNLLFNECVFDFEENLTAGFAMLTLGEAKGNLTVNATVKGGELRGGDLSTLSFYTKVGEAAKLEFEKGADGQYLVQRIKNGGSPASIGIDIDGFNYSYAEAGVDGDYTVYRVA
ncbi:MAG: Ig-like domain-containing protein, partial [Clostridia bacterium]|nr:Ig-like domain-containing protein [Clostridia bacterium]